MVDLPRGATPLDFAYHVHTSLGHRCRGARVNGRMVPLDHKLANGDTVEIITGKQPNPSRDWLVPALGYLASPRNRAKVRSWFRKLDEGQNREQGRQMLERELDRLGVRAPPLPEILAELGPAEPRRALHRPRRGRTLAGAGRGRGAPAPARAGAAEAARAQARGHRPGRPAWSSTASATC